MPSNKVILKHKQTKQVFRGEVVIDGPTKTFSGLPTGDYERTYIPPDGWNFIGKNPDTENCPNGTIVLKVVSVSNGGQASPPPPPPPPPPPGRPPWEVILPSAIGISLLSSFGGTEPLFREIGRQLLDDVPPPRSSTQTQPQNTSSPRNPTPQSRSNQFISYEVEARLRECILSNFVRLAEIPTLSGLLESASWEREPSGEFEQQLLFWYVTVGELRATIDDCDPTLTQQVIAASERYRALASVIVTGELVNVRVGSNVNEAVMDRVTKGTVLRVDQETELNLSFDQRLAIEQGIGWQPVFLPDGRRGYIYSRYITAHPSP